MWGHRGAKAVEKRVQRVLEVDDAQWRRVAPVFEGRISDDLMRFDAADGHFFEAASAWSSETEGSEVAEAVASVPKFANTLLGGLQLTSRVRRPLACMIE